MVTGVIQRELEGYNMKRRDAQRNAELGEGKGEGWKRGEVYVGEGAKTLSQTPINGKPLEP